MKILHVVGARPNFMKAAPVMEALAAYPEHAQVLVHTGQHFDAKMSDIFFTQLGLPEPDYFLGINGGSHAQMTARIMMKIEEVLEAEKPTLVLVYGDVNSTVAAALVAAKMRIFVGHVEAGLRSGDRGMPEELNRIVTDQLADLLFTPSLDAHDNLKKEGITAWNFFVGNVMIDSLVRCLPLARPPAGMDLPEPFALATLHRPANVDDPQQLAAVLQALKELAEDIPILLPIHPRTRARIRETGHAIPEGGPLRLIEPVGYLEFLWLEQHARFVVTDSGGIQEETTYLRIPCLTLRPNTERPITLSQGTNTLVGPDAHRMRAVLTAQAMVWEGLRDRPLPELWDGNAGKRIASAICNWDTHYRPNGRA